MKTVFARFILSQKFCYWQGVQFAYFFEERFSFNLKILIIIYFYDLFANRISAGRSHCLNSQLVSAPFSVAFPSDCGFYILRAL